MEHYLQRINGLNYIIEQEYDEEIGKDSSMINLDLAQVRRGIDDTPDDLDLRTTNDPLGLDCSEIVRILEDDSLSLDFNKKFDRIEHE